MKIPNYNNLEDEEVAKALEVIRVGSVVKSQIIKVARREAAQNIMATLRAVVLEQKSLNLIDSEQADYILDSIFDTCCRNGYEE